MLVTLSGIVMLFSLMQPLNAYHPISVTLLGILMLVRLLQPLNALAPMLVTLFGIVMLVRLLQPRNALAPMLVTLLGIVYEVNPAGANAISSPSLIRHLPSSDANLPLNDFRLLQPLNALSPMLVTLSGMVHSVKSFPIKRISFPLSIRHRPSLDAYLLLLSMANFVAPTSCASSYFWGVDTMKVMSETPKFLK